MTRHLTSLIALCAFPALAGLIQMPPSCTTPDGMCVSPEGKLVIAAPNNARTQPGAIFTLDAPGGTPVKWFEVPALEETGYSQPMGVCFGPEGELYVCDCNKKGLGRLLRFTFRDGQVAGCETVADHLDNANGVKYWKGRLYLTQAFLYGVERTDGAATSGIYMFNATDRNVRVGNRPTDPQCVFSDVTRNPKIKCGLNGVAIDSKGNLYTGNYGDGRIWRLKLGDDGKVAEATEFVPASAGVKTPDGLCVDAADNLYVADMFGVAAVKVTPAGEVVFLQKGGFVKPSEPCAWKGSLYVANYGATTLAELPLETRVALNGTPGENAKSIQSALDAVSAAGGGRVTIPAGTWLSGTIRLRSGVELHLEKGAVLKASPNLDDYNKEDEYPGNWPCPSEGWNACHFIIGHQVAGASITGAGTIDGNADAFFEDKVTRPDWATIAWAKGIRRQKDKVRLRPGQLIVFVRSRDLKVEGVTIRNSTCWSLFFHGCDNVVVRDYTVRNKPTDLNTDGIDIDCCSNVLLERADIDTGDDAIAIRGSQKRLGLEKPCEHIRVRDCVLSACAMGIRIGVGNGLIRDVDIGNVKVRNGAWGVSFDCWYGKKEDAGVDVENVRIHDSRFDGCYENWRFRLGGDRQAFGVRNVRFENCVFTSPKPGVVEYEGTKPLADVRFDNCSWSPAPDNPFNKVAQGKAVTIQ